MYKNSIIIEIKKPILEKLRNPPELILFSIILLKIIFFCREEKENVKINKSNLSFRIVDEKNEKIKLFNVNVSYLYSFFKGNC